MPPLDETPVADVVERHEKKTWLGFVLRPKVAIPLVMVFLALISPLLIRGYFLLGIPDPPEPFDRKAAEANRVPDDENAFTHYHRATALQIEPSATVSDTRELVNRYGWTLATPELELLLRDNEASLREWKAGTALDRAQLRPPGEYNYVSSLPSVQETREFARAVVALSHQLEANGDTAAAWEWIHALLRASRHLGSDGSNIERLVGIVVASMAIERLHTWSANPTVTAEELRRALEDYDSMLALSPTNLEVFQANYLLSIRTIEMLESGEWDWSDLNFSELLANPFLRYIRGESELGRRLLRARYLNLSPFVDLPLHLRPPTVTDLDLFDAPATLTFDGQYFDPAAFKNAAHGSEVFAYFTPSPLQMLGAMDRDLVHMQAGRIALAAQWFYRERGRFPHRLNELVPKYIPAVPEDPYTGRPFLYLAAPDRPVIYSAFQNGTDDGGVEFQYEQIAGMGKPHPEDLGFRLIVPGTIPLVAPKPAATTPEER